MTPPKHPIGSLKENYLLYFETGLILSLATFIGLFNLQFSDRSNDIPIRDIAKQEILHLERIISTTHEEIKPAPPPDVLVPNPSPKHKIIEEKLQNLNIALSPSDPIPMPAENHISEQEKITRNKNFVDPAVDLPKLVGGLEKLQKQMEYPPEAIRDNVEGRVIVKFLVDEKGIVHNPRIIKGVREDINQEALQAIAQARFLPARQRGKPIPIEQVIFILFKLDKGL